MNNYTKLLVDLANVEVVIEDEDILLSSLPDEEYETVVLTQSMINNYLAIMKSFLPLKL